MSVRLTLRIQERFEDLTPSEKKLAALLLDQPDEILTFSATELSRSAGVSKATAARLFRSLGYRDFNDVRLQAREERNRTAPVQQVSAPANPASSAVTVPMHLQAEVVNITRTFEALRSDLVAAVAGQLASGGRLWIAGRGADAGLACHARVLFAQVRPGVHVLAEDATVWPEELASTGPGDALLVVAVRSWPRAIPALLDFARTTRIHAVCITDPAHTGKAARLGAAALTCYAPVKSWGISYASVASMIALLVSAVEDRLGQSALRRIDLIGDLRDEMETS